MCKAMLALALMTLFAVPLDAKEREVREAARVDTEGKKVTVKLTGKYADCVRDGQKMGYSKTAAEEYCNKRNVK